ncbi:hypothetical protein, conserved in T. vivax [Trypanosoma vivax Y486]|uniref:Uncharacterized protein n=1 Tax=Trypanosoma vivax (strain Y486) TaxID=1055687 RepID=F9WRU3_TRYVY|nr:hypothetical protein, conserved in T. vivax [Trypanosoma vivax Y486]|eukprot:CCD20277.1 hypothetical protein, conserved in T. vivax [Trypanosoma vivax Y486]
MLKLPIAYLLVSWFLFATNHQATALQDKKEDANILKECNNNKSIKVLFNLTELRDKATFNFSCVEADSGVWVHLHIESKTEQFGGWRAGCFAGDKKTEDREGLEVKCDAQHELPLQPRHFPKKNCTFQNVNKDHRFDAFVEKKGTYSCGVWKERDKIAHKFSFTIFGDGAAGSPTSSSGTSVATVPGDGQQAVRTEPEESPTRPDAHPDASNAVPTAGGEELVATSPLGSAGSSGAQRDDALKEKDVLEQLSNQNSHGQINESIEGLYEQGNVSGVLAQTALHSPLARTYFLILISLLS